MDNFFDDLKNNLEHRPEPEFEESAWLAMQQKMQPNHNPKRAIGWWLSWLVLPLLISNIWMYFQMKNTNQLANGLQNSTVEIRRDTIFSSKTIYIRDTIFQNSSTVVSKNNTNFNFQKTQYPNRTFSKNTFFKNDFFQHSFSKNLSYNKFGSVDDERWMVNGHREILLRINSNNFLLKFPDSNISDELKNTNTLEKVENNILFNVANIEPLAIGSIGQNEVLPIYLDLEEVVILNKNIRRKRWNKITNAMRPKGFNLGFGGGYIYPTNENLSTRDGYNLNIQGYLNFSKNLRMWGDFSLILLQLKTSNLDNEYGIPNIPLPNDDYTFENANAHQPLLQFSFGMQYLFNAKKRIRPYVGFGFSAIAAQPYEVEYEYSDIDGTELIIPMDLPSQDIQANHWIINSGLEYQFRKKWVGQIEGFYRASWEKENNVTPNILGLNTRLVYKF